MILFIVKTEDGERFEILADQIAVQGAAIVFTKASDTAGDSADQQIVAVFRKVDYAFVQFQAKTVQSRRWFW